MNSSEKIEILKSRIEEVLRPLIDRDYVLLELPYYENIGDILIWEGERHFLEKLPYRCLYKASLFSYDSNYVSFFIFCQLVYGNTKSHIR